MSVSSLRSQVDRLCKEVADLDKKVSDETARATKERMFVSEAYASKAWTRHERRSALARALIEEGEYVLPARFDDTELLGLPPLSATLTCASSRPQRWWTSC
jgi:hypothetical protein